MSQTSPEEILSALRWRYATKRFDPARIIPAETWAVLEESLVLTPSSFGLQPWKFLVIEAPATRVALRGASWGQSQVTDASHFVVFTARTALSESEIAEWVSRISEIQGTPAPALLPLKRAIEGFVQAMAPDSVRDWNARQLYIALGQFMTATAVLGIDTCPMEGLDPKAYDEILDLKGSGYATVFACAAGYRAAEDRHAALPKARFAASRVIGRVQAS